MAQHAKGSFKVQLKLLDEPASEDGASLKRSLLEKTYEGDLQGHGGGQMLAALTPNSGSAGYVALERVDGALKGRSGSFVLQHGGIMERGTETLSIHVVPDSATGELAGLRGTMRIIREEGAHSYDFDYSLPS